MSGRLRVNEIFYSIQGESTWAGCPCVFIRLTGCNLRCQWCDTEYSFYQGRHLNLEQIVDQVQDYRCNLVEVTGGEPLLQKGVHGLFRLLLDKGFTVLVETSGERDLSAVDGRVIKIVDLKCPSSGECGRNRMTNLEYLSQRDEIKFVVGNRCDFDWARETIKRHQLTQRVKAVLMSPVFGALPPVDLASWILQERLPIRMQLQLHKHIWPPDMRGV